jgi:hypothetical protein
MQLILEKIFIRKTLKKYKNSLPRESNIENPKIKYHTLADAIVWEDEGIEICHPKLENALRYALNYRIYLIEIRDYEQKKHINSIEYWTYKQVQKYYPNWIGFTRNRNSYNAKISERIKRLKKVSKWKIDKMFN